MTISWKTLSHYAPDFEEAFVRYALTMTVLLLGLGALTIVSASGIQLPQPSEGHLKPLSELIGFAAVALFGFTFAIELRASARGWPFALRLVAVIGLILLFVVGFCAAYLFPGHVGNALLLEPHPLALAGIFAAIAASASGVGTDRANIRITVFLLAVVAGWFLGNLVGYLIHVFVGIFGGWSNATDENVVGILSVIIGMGLIARWLPDADDAPMIVTPNSDGRLELAKTILSPGVLLVMRHLILAGFLLASVLVAGSLLDSASNGQLVGTDNPPLSVMAVFFLAIMSGFLAFSWPFRDSSRLFSMLARVLLPVLVVAGILIVCFAVFFEYQGLTQTPFTDPVKQLGHPQSAANVHKTVLAWSMAAIAVTTALATLLWWRGRDLRLFAAVAALCLTVISFGPLNIHASYASRIAAELKPLLDAHALTQQGTLRAKDEIKWAPEASILARALVMRLAGVAALGDLPMPVGERRRLFADMPSPLPPAERLNAALERLNLGPDAVVAMQGTPESFDVYFNAQQPEALDVAGFDIVFFTALAERQEMSLMGRKVLLLTRR